MLRFVHVFNGVLNDFAICGLETNTVEVAVAFGRTNRISSSRLVTRLLAQLREMEMAFDGFWEKHQLKMEQFLQLWKFEQHFQEVNKDGPPLSLFQTAAIFFQQLRRTFCKN